MKLRTKWLLAGGAWGVVAAWVAPVWVTGTLAGFFWLWVFGDDPWPGWTGPVLVAVGLVAAAASALVVTVAGHFVGRKLEGTGSRWPHRGAYMATAAAVAIGALLAQRAWSAAEDRASSGEATERAEAYLETLRPEVDAELGIAGDEVRLGASALDPGGGRYEARVSLVSELSRGAPLRTLTDTVRLDPTTRTAFGLAVSVDTVRRRFVSRNIEGGDAAWAVDLGLEARVRLAPLPPPSVADELPSGAWNSLLLLYGRASPADTARTVLPLRSDRR